MPTAERLAGVSASVETSHREARSIDRSGGRGCGYRGGRGGRGQRTSRERDDTPAVATSGSQVFAQEEIDDLFRPLKAQIAVETLIEQIKAQQQVTNGRQRSPSASRREADRDRSRSAGSVPEPVKDAKPDANPSAAQTASQTPFGASSRTSFSALAPEFIPAGVRVVPSPAVTITSLPTPVATTVKQPASRPQETPVSPPKQERYTGTPPAHVQIASNVITPVQPPLNPAAATKQSHIPLPQQIPVLSREEERRTRDTHHPARPRTTCVFPHGEDRGTTNVSPLPRQEPTFVPSHAQEHVSESRAPAGPSIPDLAELVIRGVLPVTALSQDQLIALRLYIHELSADAEPTPAAPPIEPPRDKAAAPVYEPREPVNQAPLIALGYTTAAAEPRPRYTSLQSRPVGPTKSMATNPGNTFANAAPVAQPVSRFEPVIQQTIYTTAQPNMQSRTTKPSRTPVQPFVAQPHARDTISSQRREEVQASSRNLQFEASPPISDTLNPVSVSAANFTHVIERRSQLVASLQTPIHAVVRTEPQIPVPSQRTDISTHSKAAPSAPSFPTQNIAQCNLQTAATPKMTLGERNVPQMSPVGGPTPLNSPVESKGNGVRTASAWVMDEGGLRRNAEALPPRSQNSNSTPRERSSNAPLRRPSPNIHPYAQCSPSARTAERARAQAALDNLAPNTTPGPTYSLQQASATSSGSTHTGTAFGKQTAVPVFSIEAPTNLSERGATPTTATPIFHSSLSQHAPKVKLPMSRPGNKSENDWIVKDETDWLAS